MHDESDLTSFSDMTEVFGVESFLLKSVGITIGSSTSHLMFSRLTVRRSDCRGSRFTITERDVIHRSPIIFTPYAAALRIDGEKLRDFVDAAYRDAGIRPDEVDTGAVIITGYASRKENAEAILNLFSRWAGKFVCATAGPRLEGIMAAHGSGAVSRSKATGETVMNIDIGGGTSKMVIVRDGAVVDGSSLFVGSRVVAVDDAGRVVRIEPAASLAAKRLGIPLSLGAPLPENHRQLISALLADSLMEVVERNPLSSFTRDLFESPPLCFEGPMDVVTFSGGVAEYIYGREESDFGDLGRFLGEDIRTRVSKSVLAKKLRQPEERIRATVMGAAQHSLQVSGNTIYVSKNAILPKRDLPVVTALIEGERPAAECIERTLREALSRYDAGDIRATPNAAMAIRLSPETIVGPSLLRNLRDAILLAVDGPSAGSRPIVLMFDSDIANLVGSLLADKAGAREIICIDEIEAGDLDYVDIGAEIESSRTVPVVIKNLVFLNSRSNSPPAADSRTP